MMLNLVAVIVFAVLWRSAMFMGPPLSCCTAISHNKIPVKNIVEYTLQKSPPCPVRAVRFVAINGKSICSDPESTWSKLVMKEVDSKKRTTTIQTSQGGGSVTIIAPTTNQHQTESTPSFNKLNEEEFTVEEHEPSPTKYTRFCLENEPAEGTSNYFCIDHS